MNWQGHGRDLSLTISKYYAGQCLEELKEAKEKV
jgi:hypothetical protein